jgi:hypothetical protein
MCCASNEIKHVIVMVLLYCWAFTFIVFVGDGWLALVPAHLPHLKLLSLKMCKNVSSEHIAEIVAAVPELLVITNFCNHIGGLGSKLREESHIVPDRVA